MRKSSVSHQKPDDAQPCSLPSCLWAPSHLTQENNRKMVYAKPVRYRKQIQPEGHVKGVRNWVKVQVTESKPVQQVLTGVQDSMWTAYKFYAVKGWECRRHQLRTHRSHRWWGLQVKRVPNKIQIKISCIRKALSRQRMLSPSSPSGNSINNLRKSHGPYI